MRKYSIIVLIMLLILNMSVFAGSIPEDAVHDEAAQVFFARFVSYRPNDKGETEVNLIPTKGIKGDVVLGESLWYDEPAQIGDFVVTAGEEYLFLYFDKNNPTYFFKTTSQDTKTLKFENTTGDMWDRLEKYFNDGRFEDAEKMRLEKKEQAQSEPVKAVNPDAEKNNKNLYIAAIGVVLGITLVHIAVKGKSKNEKD